MEIPSSIVEAGEGDKKIQRRRSHRVENREIQGGSRAIEKAANQGVCPDLLNTRAFRIDPVVIVVVILVRVVGFDFID